MHNAWPDWDCKEMVRAYRVSSGHIMTLHLASKSWSFQEAFAPESGGPASEKSMVNNPQWSNCISNGPFMSGSMVSWPTLFFWFLDLPFRRRHIFEQVVKVKYKCFDLKSLSAKMLSLPFWRATGCMSIERQDYSMSFLQISFLQSSSLPVFSSQRRDKLSH